MATYKLTTTSTARQQNGGDAGKIQAGLIFESSTSRIIRDAPHRKIENGSYMGLYLHASACVEYTTEPPVDPPVEPPVDTFPAYIPIGAEWVMHFKIDGQITQTYTFVRTS